VKAILPPEIGDGAIVGGGGYVSTAERANFGLDGIARRDCAFSLLHYGRGVPWVDASGLLGMPPADGEAARVNLTHPKRGLKWSQVLEWLRAHGYADYNRPQRATGQTIIGRLAAWVPFVATQAESGKKIDWPSGASGMVRSRFAVLQDADVAKYRGILNELWGLPPDAFEPPDRKSATLVPGGHPPSGRVRFCERIVSGWEPTWTDTVRKPNTPPWSYEDERLAAIDWARITWRGRWVCGGADLDQRERLKSFGLRLIEVRPTVWGIRPDVRSLTHVRKNAPPLVYVSERQTFKRPPPKDWQKEKRLKAAADRAQRIQVIEMSPEFAANREAWRKWFSFKRSTD
jgi:hypothetical protein